MKELKNQSVRKMKKVVKRATLFSMICYFLGLFNKNYDTNNTKKNIK